MMREHCDKGGAIFFSTHVLEVAEKLCDKVAIIKQGRLVKEGTMEEVKGDESLEVIPMVILLGRYTVIGPVGMYGCVKLIDLIKLAVFHVWLKKERWLKNLTGREALVRS
jgi:ABC-type uncharacterized transport system ATPase subunit